MSTPMTRRPRAQDHKPRDKRPGTHARRKHGSPGEPSPAPAGVPVAPEQRRAMIAEAAYYRAERRGFEPGYEIDDWCSAERDIERALGRDDDTPTRCG